MKSKTFTMIFLGISFLLSAQESREEVEVLKKMIYEIGKSTYIYLDCEKEKTYFDSYHFIKMTRLAIPKDVLNDFTNAAKQSQSGQWDFETISKLAISANILYPKKCLTNKGVHKLYRKTEDKNKVSVISISQPIFDSKQEHCIIKVDVWKHTKISYFTNYFLKKVYGRWVVVAIHE